jgi:hypothetical protein
VVRDMCAHSVYSGAHVVASITLLSSAMVLMLLYGTPHHSGSGFLIVERHRSDASSVGGNTNHEEPEKPRPAHRAGRAGEVRPSWSVERSNRHLKIRLDGCLVGILKPGGGDDGSWNDKLNQRAQVRRAIREATG